MSKPTRGTKRVCPSCGARFYDLSRTPIVCPACQAMYQVTPAQTRRSERAQAPEPRVAEKVELKVVPVKGPEIISLEDAEEAGEEIPIEEEEEIADLGDTEAEIPAADDDNTFLEQEGDEGPDVSGIVSGPGQGEES
jgi:uncharacterized protein (TIGR02300 family)